ncbi:hypothetical protein N7492_000268 [Penicillium capsulatum]|uniref:Glycosyl transferase n=1 Tax=Penicillium capsulatum TaxID=69766 RepID=A0A9W9IRJ1_9EURO|nr:hypothetical protein N7492_000268 [Penicillium capsulatum]
MAEKRNPRHSVVEDVFVPKPLLATTKFNSPWELTKWEKSLPKNDRVQHHYSAAVHQKQTAGLSRSASLSALRVPRRTFSTRRRSNPPELQVYDDFKSAPPKTTEVGSEPITPIKEAAIYANPVSPKSSQNFSSSEGTMQDVYEKAKARGVAIQRKYWVRLLFEATVYTLLVLFIYFVLVGMPLWKGAVWWLYFAVKTKFVIQGGYAITIGLAALYAFCPLLILFDKDPPPPELAAQDSDPEKNATNVKSTALLIPCYKSAQIIGPTLKAALEIFPPHNIFVIANGNSDTPLDDTEDVCRPYGVNHLWVPVGSKIVAQFAGCYAAKGFDNVLLIDDDCALPPNFPIVSDRLQGRVKCIGYTIKSVGPDSSKGTWCQQAQDLEYKMSGLQRAFFGKFGSATFPHGAISLWNTEFLKMTFHEHPGFSVSEDWFFGDSCRRLGGRITMCSSVFVETETPSSVFISGSGSRGGFGEMTIFQQRFKRWNFFFWKLGWYEIGAKLCVFQEVYETLIYLFAPFILPISFIVRPGFCGMLLGVTIGMYVINVIIFNEIHLRLKKERIGWGVMIIYYTFYKIALTVINVVSCYWSLYKYARYFAKRHPKVIEDRQAVEVVLSLERDTESPLLEDDELAPLPEVEDVNRTLKRLTMSRVEAPRRPRPLSAPGSPRGFDSSPWV